MNDLDHMLNGSGSRRHHQEIIRLAQHAKVAREVKPLAKGYEVISALRVIIGMIINLIVRLRGICTLTPKL